MKTLLALFLLTAQARAQIAPINGGAAQAAATGGAGSFSTVAASTITSSVVNASAMTVGDGAKTSTWTNTGNLTMAVGTTVAIDSGTTRGSLAVKGALTVTGVANATFFGSTLTVATTGIVSMPSQPGASVNTVSNITTEGGIITPIYWTNTNYSHQGTFVAASSSTFVAKAAGGYRITCNLPYAASVSAGVRARITASGADYDGFGVTSAVGATTVSQTITISMAAGETAVCKAFSGTTQTLSAGFEANFSMEKVW